MVVGWVKYMRELSFQRIPLQTFDALLAVHYSEVAALLVFESVCGSVYMSVCASLCASFGCVLWMRVWVRVCRQTS